LFSNLFNNVRVALKGKSKYRTTGIECPQSYIHFI
jgi:hypothetical protein